jgi:hypothetical protein
LNYGKAVYKNQQRSSPGCQCRPHDRSVQGWYCY